MVDKEPVYWIGTEPDKCELCGSNLAFGFYDARLPKAGCWGMICNECFKVCGCKLGVGNGQKYLKREGRWLKTAG